MASSLEVISCVAAATPPSSPNTATFKELLRMAIDGQWDITVDTPMGVQRSVLTLKTDGATLTGEQLGQFGVTPLKDGKVDGDALSWRLELTVPFPIKLDVEATVTGDSIEGQVKTPMGVSPLKGARKAGNG
jgi:hypothetical protein